MPFFLIFLLSVFLTLTIIFLNKKLNIGSDSIYELRKVHENSTSRIGGVAIFVSFFSIIILNRSLEIFDSYLFFIFLMFFLFVLIEDLKGVLKPSYRLSAIIIFSLILVLELNLSITNLGIPVLDLILDYPALSIFFTTISLSLLANGFNLLDGFNGLTSGFTIIVLAILTETANEVSEPEISMLSSCLMMAVLGFFVLNFPFGKVFLGDSGAYFLGLTSGILALILAERSENISYWFVLALFIYPVYELIFSMIRRGLYEKSKASQADGLHLHHLIYKKMVNCSYFPRKEFCNSTTSIIMLSMASSSLLPAYIWADSPVTLFSICIIFMAIYTSIFLKLR